jgi:predicted membrane metal-binding protein
MSTEKSHLLCFYICGFNVSIIAALFILGFSRLLGRMCGVVAAILGIGLNTVLVGASYSVLRAAIMGVFVLFAR